MNIDDDEQFYGACAAALGIAHEYVKPVSRRTRWNNRRLGNGRFPGFGLVRAYGRMVIIISRSGTMSFTDRELALKWLNEQPRSELPRY